jgi:hypothetical protein
VLEPILKRKVDVPERLARFAQRPVLADAIRTDVQEFVKCLRKALR